MMFYLNGKSVSNTVYANTLGELKALTGVDGFFETMACVSGHIPLKEFHLARLNRSAVSTGIEQNLAKLFASDLAQLKLPEKGVLKYEVLFEAQTNTPQRLLEIQAPRNYPASYWQKGVSVLVSSESLECTTNHHGIKSIKRPLYERATLEYSNTDCAEALILNTNNELIEGTKTNVFGIKDNCLITPELSAAGVSGVMRAFIVQLATRLGVSVRIEAVKIEDLPDMEAVFVTNALIGLWPLRSLCDAHTLLTQWDVAHPLIQIIKNKLPQGFVHA